MKQLVQPSDVQRIRESVGLSQAQLAKLTGLTRSQISRIETGASWPRQSTLKRISEALVCEKVRQTRLELVREPEPAPGEVLLEEGVNDSPTILEVFRPDLAWLASVMVRITSKHSGQSGVTTAFHALQLAEGFEHDFIFEVVEPATFSSAEVFKSADIDRLPAKLEEWRKKQAD